MTMKQESAVLVIPLLISVSTQCHFCSSKQILMSVLWVMITVNITAPTLLVALSATVWLVMNCKKTNIVAGVSWPFNVVVININLVLDCSPSQILTNVH